MMKNSLKHIIILIFCFSIAAKAQTNCDQNSKQAEEFYIGGDYENCIQTIEKLFNECSLSSKKEEVALEFLAKSYLQQDNVALAEKTVQRLLKNNPYYELKENSEDEDFEILVNKFHIHPLFSIGVRNTGMFPKLATTKTFTISDNFNYDSRYVTAKTLLLYYVVAEYEFKKTYSINADILGFNMAYSRNLTKNADYRLNIKENLTFFEIPVYLKKYFPIGKNFLTYTT
jgi:tetratricopeptide (TPR) repeat protein